MIDQRLFTIAKSGGAPRRSGGSGDQPGFLHLTCRQRAGPVDPRGEDVVAFQQDRAMFADPFLDQPVSQLGTLPP